MDKELLELAAKAAGKNDLKWHEGDQSMCLYNKAHVCWYTDNFGDRMPWNPLTDDGDALRLLTKLPYRELYCSDIGATVSWRRADRSGHGFKCDEYAHEHNGDLNAATRLAIVRAAAEIGREMP